MSKIIIRSLILTFIISLIIIMVLLVRDINHPLIWSIPLFIFVISILGYKYNDKITEDLTTKAQVVSKTMQPTRTVTFYYVSFEIAGGTRINLEANVDQYNTISENETGILNYHKIKNRFRLVDFKGE